MNGDTNIGLGCIILLLAAILLVLVKIAYMLGDIMKIVGAGR